ncbi:MAG: hypothetical protein AMXMBFR13_18140 [Phycisphaerae bacterium]
MKRTFWLCSVAGAILGLAGMVFADEVEVQLPLETFDGCGCMPDNPPACTTCEDLNGSGCNIHDGNTNNPSSECASAAGVPYPFPNMDYFGPQSVDDDWSNGGYPVDYAGDFGIHNDPGPFPPNQASQKFTLPVGQFGGQEAAILGYISPADPQVKVSIFGQIDIEALRIAYGLPEPAPGTGAYMAVDVRRVGDGTGGTDPQNPGIRMRTDLIAVTHQPVPSDVVGTYEPDETRMIPNDSEWHTYRVASFNKLPEKTYMGVGITMISGTGSYPISITEPVDVWIDNLRIVYLAVPQPEVCDNEVDDDLDGLVDCDDSDCAGSGICTGCFHDPVFDVDDDNDVDQTDFGFFQACYTGAGDPGNVFASLSAECQCMDIAGVSGPDNAIDQQEFGRFQLCISGPELPVDPACDD